MRRFVTPMALALVGCAAEPGPSPALLDDLRVLAVRAEPPEAAPGEAVRLWATVADTSGVRDDLAVEWSWCAAPKPPTEDNVVSPACLADAVVPIGRGDAVEAALPADGCRLFGPESPGPGLRPRDPDVTGGYHQPVRLAIDGVVAFGAVRLRCALAQAPLSVAQAFAADYAPNHNPVITALDGPPTATPGQRIPLRVETDAPEAYLRFDPASRDLETVDERYTVSWFVTGGALDPARGDVDAGAAEASWTAPAEAGAHSVIAVVRDSRGGVDVIALRVDVR